jgi:hypothetical protein
LSNSNGDILIFEENILLTNLFIFYKFIGEKDKRVVNTYWEFQLFRYHLKDVIIGKIYFLLVRIKIKNMDLEIRRRESTGSGTNTHVETETLAKFELMDGAPVRGRLIFKSDE